MFPCHSRTLRSSGKHPLGLSFRLVYFPDFVEPDRAAQLPVLLPKKQMCYDLSMLSARDWR